MPPSPLPRTSWSGCGRVNHDRQRRHRPNSPLRKARDGEFGGEPGLGRLFQLGVAQLSIRKRSLVHCCGTPAGQPPHEPAGGSHSETHFHSEVQCQPFQQYGRSPERGKWPERGVSGPPGTAMSFGWQDPVPLFLVKSSNGDRDMVVMRWIAQHDRSCGYGY